MRRRLVAHGLEGAADDVGRYRIHGRRGTKRRASGGKFPIQLKRHGNAPRLSNPRRSPIIPSTAAVQSLCTVRLQPEARRRCPWDTFALRWRSPSRLNSSRILKMHIRGGWSMADAETYDVIVVGSGSAGAMAALRAHERGLSVLIVE